MSRFLRLDQADRKLLVQCACALAVMRLGLCALSIRKLHALVARVGPAGALPAARRRSAERIAWAIRATARYTPGASCLPQALAAQLMLARHGHPARLRIGMAVTGERKIVGHAWVEGAEGRVMGGAEEGYAPLDGVVAETP